MTNGELIGTAIQGGLIMIFFSSGIALQSDLSHLKNDFKLQDMIVSSPTSAGTYMGGMAAAELVYFIPGIAILVTLAAIFIQPDIIQIAVLTSVLLLMFCGFSYHRLYALHNLKRRSAKLRLLTPTLIAICHPAASILPHNLPTLPTKLPLAYLSPTTYAAEIMHSATGYLNISTTHLLIDWGSSLEPAP